MWKRCDGEEDEELFIRRKDEDKDEVVAVAVVKELRQWP